MLTICDQKILNPTNPITDELRVKFYNETKGTLDSSVVDCKECLNRGNIAILDREGHMRTRECSCMAKRRSYKYLKKSGLEKMIAEFSLNTWEENEDWQTFIKTMAVNFIKNPDGWFFLAGTPGTGKTRMCTSICKALIDKGYETKYVLWRDLASRAKSIVTDGPAYKEKIEPLKRIKVLYIDDFLKSGRNTDPTTFELNLAFELLNNRYNNDHLITILSSEWTMELLFKLDEALASRIQQRARKYYCDLTGKTNWRTKELEKNDA